MPADNLLPAQRLNVVDRAITFFNPAAGERRMVSRARLNHFGYNDHAERRSTAPPIRGSETWIANRDRLKMMADARDLASYDWIGGVIAKVVLYVCGRIHAKSQTGDEEIDQSYDDYFHGWCGDERNDDGTTRCDVTGRHRLIKMVQMAFLAFFVDGDHGLVEVEPEYDEKGKNLIREYSLQNVEADRIGSPLDATNDEYYIGGVSLDPETGKVTSYRVFRRNRNGMYVEPVEVLPSDFIHVFDPDKNDEYRGRTKLLRVLNDLRDIREWIEAEKVAGKTQAQWAALVGSKDPFQGTGPDAWTGKTTNGTPSQDAIWGKILKMAQGDTFSMLSPSARPSGAFMAFVQTLIRKMSIALNLPYGFLWDLATLGGVTARIEVQGALRQIQYWQDNIIISLILDRVRSKVIAQGITERKLVPHPRWKKCEWHFGPWISTDAGYEMDADIAGIRTGILKVENVTGKYGDSPMEVFRSNAATANAAIAVGAETELPVEVFAEGLFPRITNQKAAYLSGPMPPPKPGSIDAIGDKGVGKLLELLEAVGKGEIDREAGISALVTVFGFTQRGAEKICPQEPDEASLNREAGLSPDGKHAPVGAKIVVSGKSEAKKPTKKPTPKKK